jgi:hypothetical protein
METVQGKDKCDAASTKKNQRCAIEEDPRGQSQERERELEGCAE